MGDDPAALIVSVDQNDDPHLQSLGGAVRRDADAVAAVLKDRNACGFTHDRVGRIGGADATATAIEQKILSMGRDLSENAPFLFYYSGHGGVISGEACLEARDANTLTNENRITMSRLATAFNTVPSKRKLLIIDACYSGGLSDIASTWKSARAPYNPLILGEGTVVIASSDRSQPSAIMHGDPLSLFTKHLVQGLKGAAAVPGRPFIGVFDLFNYVAEAVVAELPGQEPVYAAHHQKSNFAVAITPPSIPSSISKQSGFAQDMVDVSSVFSALYPLGPRDRDIWERSSGRLEALDLSGAGRTQWFRACRHVSRGGLPPLIRLVEAGLQDYPFNEKLGTLSVPSS